MKDVQSEKALRNIPLKHVGIKGLRWPIELRDKARGTQHSVAEVTLAVDLPHDMRGTHMSRFVECLRTLGPVGLADVEAILDEVIFIKDGRIVLQSTVEDIREQQGKSVDAYFREVFVC